MHAQLTVSKVKPSRPLPNHLKRNTMNTNSKKKLLFGTMGGSPGSTHQNFVAQRKNQSRATVSAREGGESGAVFRSVSMGMTMNEPPAMFARSHTKIVHKAHSMPDAYTSMNTSEGKTTSKNLTRDIATLLANAPTSIQIQNQTQSQVQAPTEATDRSHESWVWILTPQQLQPIPVFHPMERTAITIDDLPLLTITTRISEFLRQHSIPAKYSKDSSRVDCMTDSLLKFVVQLWRSPGASSGVVIEIQRRQGSCLAMQDLRRHLLDAVHTEGTTNASTAPNARSSRSTCGFVQDLLDRTNLPPPPSNLPCGRAALDLSKKLIETHRLDAQRLGLESLCSLTDPRQVLLRDADEVSRTLLTDSSWQTLLRHYFLNTKVDKNLEVRRVFPGDSHVNLVYEQGECFGILHFLALKIITQSIESMAATYSNNNSDTSILDLGNPFWGSVLDSLYYNLTVPSSRPLEAAWSIRCLRYLQTMQPHLMHTVPSERGLYDCLVQAHDYGKQFHQSLQQETEQWMNVLGFAY